MSIVQWLLLILILIVVIGVYLYMRRQAAGDPWRDMDEPEQGPEEGAIGDSYVVGVRTLNHETPADRKAAAAARADRPEDVEADTATDRTRSVRGQPKAVHRRPAPPEPVPEPLLRRSAQVRSSEIEMPRGLAAQEPESEAPQEAPVEPAADAQRSEPAPARPRHSAGGRADMVAPQPTPESQVFILYVAAPSGQRFAGEAVHETLAACGLRFGLNDLYHRVTEKNGVTESIFTVANMVKPGTLHPQDADTLESPGLALFLLVPGPVEGRPAMHDMMETAHQITTRLGGSVLDDKRALLKAQTAQFMLDEIAEIDRRARLARRR